MKIKVFTLVTDGSHMPKPEDLDVRIFSSEERLREAQREIVLRDIDGDESADAYAIQLLLDSGDVAEAWGKWQSAITPKYFRAKAGEQEIEIESPDLTALVAAATYVECRLSDACDFGILDKSQFYPSWQKITEALKPFSTACNMIPKTNEIKLYFHCARCLKDKPSDVSPKDWSKVQAGFTPLGVQVWCNRCNGNIVHIDFEGQTHPANTFA